MRTVIRWLYQRGELQVRISLTNAFGPRQHRFLEDIFNRDELGQTKGECEANYVQRMRSIAPKCCDLMCASHMRPQMGHDDSAETCLA